MIENQLIILLTYTDWGFPCDFEKQTALRLARTNRVVVFSPLTGRPLYRILFNSDTRYWFEKQLAFGKSSSLQFFPAIYLIPFHRLKLVAVANKWLVFILLALYVFLESKRLQCVPVFWTFSSESADFLALLQRFFKKCRIVYDCVDFHSSIISSENQQIIKDEKKISAIADTVFVNSYTLYKLKHKTHTNIHRVPQGCDTEFFLDIPKTSCPERLQKIKPPIVGFVGVIDHRLDFNLLINVATDNQDISFLFIGPRGRSIRQDAIAQVSKKIRALKRLSNIHFLDEQPKSTIASYMDQFDICMIPYRVEEAFNRYSFPMKTLEYFARGKPVITTPIEELSQFGSCVKIAATPREWTYEMKELLKKPWPLVRRRQQAAIARMNSWDNKIQAMTLS